VKWQNGKMAKLQKEIIPLHSRGKKMACVKYFPGYWTTGEWHCFFIKPIFLQNYFSLFVENSISSDHQPRTLLMALKASSGVWSTIIVILKSWLSMFLIYLVKEHNLFLFAGMVVSW
jgi:hypothetical protein